MHKILVVDDDAAVRLLFADELAEEGYRVTTCGDGSKLMGIVREDRPNLIVMDIKLNGESGLDLLQNIRKAYSNLPVILCSAHPRFMHDPNLIHPDYYVVKSSNLEELKGKIKMALEG